MDSAPIQSIEPSLAKYTLNEEQEKKEIIRHYRALLKALRPKLKKGDKELLRTAFEMAANAHKTMRRKSGEPYILHPIAVAMICVEEIGLGVRSTICALLHDTVEDTDISLEDVEMEFGTEIAKIVDGLTKISGVIDTNTSQQAENFKKILLTLTDDPRVILIKLADRLHNMRTLDHMKREKQLKIASETVWVYAPLAHRMGLYSIKTELEDLSMKYMEPEAYKDIAKKLSETKRERTRYINEFIRPIREKLVAADFDFEIYGRPKSIHSIWNKIKKKSVAFEEVYDLFAIRVILNAPPEKEKEQCWKVYSMITDEYNPSPERLRDWLSNPKSNGYEALHTTVMGPQGKWVEVQIRTKRMNEIAEKGLAAHFKYKEGKDGNDEDRFDKWFGQIREVLGAPDTDGVDFLQDFKTSFLAEEIYVYTPKGEVKMLPTGSTALDFAFSIHSAIGTKCIGAKVHHKLVPIGHKLRSGDQIEIITSNKQKPSEDWLNMVVTAKAKNKIKDSLREEKRKIAEDGKYVLQRRLESIGAAYSQHNIDELMQFYKLNSALDLNYKIATKAIDLRELKDFQILGDKIEIPKPKPVFNDLTADPTKPISKKDSELIIFGESSDKIMYTLAKCCNPIPGDDVFGFVSTGKGLIIHRTSCPNATQLLANYGHRVVKTKWAKNKEISFLTGLKIVGLDDVGVINKITNVISGDLRINISGLSIDSREGLFEGTIKVFVHDKEELEELVNRLKSLNGIQTVDRFDTEKEG
ncbi:bifunctional (p)ppGpp synthetase/guanosine-3',5'-bis(diphosphate) 3'-pyrophosphohydrolase [Sediminibacterium sp.]|uniref:RelA/SpoT family protein n=1 Tax=Sediminibacterium sp. TaxID=1917865 RepID=UPI0027350E7E|nr:RelA/SpoT family protein [Sediminibacterium sp.]MDP3393266.1 RelA/SpoT family protein [Sediminibacterium sp.]MDP3567868.1 RelA/SpoT family protein [Sediminibacterium sp.]